MRTSLVERAGCEFLRVHITYTTVDAVLFGAHWFELHAH
jgi:hypothetical protein